MRLYIIAVPLFVFLFACGTRKQQNTAKDKTGENNTPGSYKVSGTIQYYGSYCGGAEPSEEILAEVRKHRPYHGKKLFIISGYSNDEKKPIIDTIISDTAGKFELQLPPGEYCIIQPEQRTKSIITRYDNDKDFVEADPKCMQQWWITCLYSFKVENTEVKDISLLFYRPCFLPEGIPCLSYSGPMPP